MIRLTRPEPTDAQLRAMAASGASGLAKNAQAALRQRVNEALRKAVSQ